MKLYIFGKKKESSFQKCILFHGCIPIPSNMGKIVMFSDPGRNGYHPNIDTQNSYFQVDRRQGKIFESYADTQTSFTGPIDLEPLFSVTRLKNRGSPNRAISSYIMTQTIWRDQLRLQLRSVVRSTSPSHAV